MASLMKQPDDRVPEQKPDTPFCPVCAADLEAGCQPNEYRGFYLSCKCGYMTPLFAAESGAVAFVKGEWRTKLILDDLRVQIGRSRL